MADVQTTNQSILVAGGGISGITAALEAAEAGYDVVLIEKNPFLGGRVTQLHQYFPKLCPPNCGLEINFKRMKVNPRIRFFTMAEIAGISGQEGDYTVSVKISPRYVNEKCTCCGICKRACPYGAVVGKKKQVHSINLDLCQKCGICKSECDFEAIQVQ